MAIIVFEDHLAEVLSAANEALQRAAEIIGGTAESHAKEYITEAVYQSPEGWYVRTGNLRNSITHGTEDDGHTVVIGTNIEYAPYVELGTGKYAGGRQTPWRYLGNDGKWHTTSGMPPRPYLRPAIEKHKEEYKKILESELKGEE